MSYVARSDATVLLVPQTVVDQLIFEDPTVYAHLAGLAIERCGRALRWTLESQALQPEILLRRRLADLVEMRQADDPEARSEIRLPQQEIAALVGISRQTANAILKRLEQDGLVRIGSRKIYVPDVAALRG